MCENSENPDIKILAKYSTQILLTQSVQHLSGILIAFERVIGRSIRDDEYIVEEGDRSFRADDSKSQRRAARDASTSERNAPQPITLALDRTWPSQVEAAFSKSKARKLTLIADNIRSSFNVGAMFRTAECFGVQDIILSGYTPTPESPATQKTTMGADVDINWRQTRRLADAASELKADGYELVALETVKTAVPLEAFRWPKKSALIVGNERFGLDPEQLRLADHIIRLPLAGIKNSLNVGIAAGIAIHHWAAQTEERSYQPIGYFKTDLKQPADAPRQGVVSGGPQVEGYIELKPHRDFEQALSDLDGFDRVWIVFEFNQAQNWKPKVRPPRGSTEKRGLFATRSPHRPNPIGMTCARLISAKGLRVSVAEFDLIDGTPILDIKPYLPYADAFPNAKTGWVAAAELETTHFDISYQSRASAQLEWLRAHGLSQIGEALNVQLSSEPLDGERKRISRGDTEGQWCLAYRTWRIIFEADLEKHRINVLELKSGYTAIDMSNNLDTYGDKQIHREFLVHFSQLN
jgi:tRNA (adenine37-N6)-methyltransferase